MKAILTPTEIIIDSHISQRDAIKALRGSRWDRSLKRWTFPATPHAAQVLGEAFPDLAGTLEEVSRTGPMPGLDGFKTSLWEHQSRAVMECWDRPASMLAMEMRAPTSVR